MSWYAKLRRLWKNVKTKSTCILCGKNLKVSFPFAASKLILNINSYFISDLLLQMFIHFSINTYFDSSQADKKKQEGNRLYNNKNYRDALQRYSEAIGKDYIK